MQENARYEFGDEEYSHAKAYSMAIAAKLAYENTDIIRCEVAKWGFPHFQVYRYHTSGRPPSIPCVPFSEHFSAFLVADV
jgi:hypothetical protein